MTSKLIICSNCKEEFYKPERLILKRNFCCRECFTNFKKTHPQFYKQGYQTDAMRKLLAYAEIRKNRRLNEN